MIYDFKVNPSVVMIPCYFDHKMSMCCDHILICLVRIPYYRNLDKSAVVGKYFRILLSNVSTNSHFLGIIAIKPEI